MKTVDVPNCLWCGKPLIGILIAETDVQPNNVLVYRHVKCWAKRKDVFSAMRPAGSK